MRASAVRTEVDSRPANNLLRRLSAADYALLAPHVSVRRLRGQPSALQSRRRRAGGPLPLRPASLATFLVPNEDGRDVETILVGREGAVGGIVSEGFLPAYTRICVKFGGPFARIHVGKLEAAEARSPSLRNIFARYADCMLAQIFQSTACNAIHSIEQRTAKWILAAMERTGDEHSVPLTHEQLATLLGWAAAMPSRVLQSFKAEGVLDTRRGSILVRNRDGLRLRACLCNDAVKMHFEEVLRGVYPTEEREAG